MLAVAAAIIKVLWTFPKQKKNTAEVLFAPKCNHFYPLCALQLKKELLYILTPYSHEIQVIAIFA